MPQKEIGAVLRDNPRLIGVLFTACLLLAQALPVLAGSGGSNNGP